MGQVEVLEVLISEKRWMTSREIYEKIGNLSLITICYCLQRLSKYNEIKRRKCKTLCRGYEYKWNNQTQND